MTNILLQLPKEIQDSVLTLFESDVKSRFETITDWSHYLHDPCLEACFIYRLSHALFKLNNTSRYLTPLANKMHRRTGIQIYYSNEIGPGLNIQHGLGIVIGPRNSIGKNLCIHQGVTIGQRHLNSPDEHAIIGDNVTLFAGCKIIGSVHIGDNVTIGANSVLLNDAHDGVWVGVPAKKQY